MKEISSKTNADLHKLIDHDPSKHHLYPDVIKKVPVPDSSLRFTTIREKEIVGILKKEGFKNFTKSEHQKFWKTLFQNTSNRNKSLEAKKYGEAVPSGDPKCTWYWYKETWLPKVRDYCKQQYPLNAEIL